MDKYKNEFERLMADENVADFIVPFGAHQGKTLENIPLGYLDWLIGQKWLKSDTKEIIEEYLSDPVIKRELEADLED